MFNTREASKGLLPLHILMLLALIPEKERDGSALLHLWVVRVFKVLQGKLGKWLKWRLEDERDNEQYT